jgi:glycosyltransferase involved in cell wall biosynthesis
MLRPIAREANAFRKEHGLEDRFVVMYSGNLGVGHDVVTFVDAARQLERSHPEIVMLFIGDGVRRSEAETRARGSSNVRFLPYQPEASVGQSLAAADVHLISLREDLEGLLVPSKLYAAAAVGRPILFVGPLSCEVARVVREHDLGWAGRPGDASGLARAIVEAASSRATSDARGARARAVFEREFERKIATESWRDTLERAAEAGGPRRDG